MKEAFQGSGIRGVEGRETQRVELARGPLKALRIPAGEDSLCTFNACPPGGFEPDAAATSDHHHGLPEESGLP